MSTFRMFARCPQTWSKGCHPALPFRGPGIRSGIERPRQVAVSAQSVSDLPTNLRKIVGAFQMVPDPMSRYKQLLYFAAKLNGLPDDLKVEENKVQGCVSQVWVVAEVRADGTMHWRADSDAQLTKGLAALLLEGLNGCTPLEVCSIEPDFIEMLGLKQSLTPSRNNGFLNMFRLMQSQALQGMKELGQVSSGEAEPTGASAGPSGSNGASDSARRASVNAASVSWEPTAECPKPVAASMRQKLTEALSPVNLEIADDSASHAGHAGARETNSPSGETHFKVTVVSAAFEGLNSVKRHRLVYGLLQDELSGPVHALNLVTKTPGEI